MGFSAAAPKSLAHCFSLRNSDHKHVQFQSFKYPPRRIISCKLESMGFEERMSPNEIATLLDCTSWSGAGSGLMDAVTKGALQAGKAVGGFKIGKEAGEWTATNFHSYLPSETYLTCRFFSARKHGLVDAAVRSSSLDKTAVIGLPGGIGTLDEIFELMALIQLDRIGSVLPVPFLLMNYDSFYSKLLDFLHECEHWGTLSKGEAASIWKVCNNNTEALSYLSEFYSDKSVDNCRQATPSDCETAL
nr:probable cytokinin riboside 5'-monophosphate phosphoribohydrolase LOGL10 [Ipomoea batatas]